MCAAVEVVQSNPEGNRKQHKSKSHSKGDGLLALAIALSAMSDNEVVSSTSSWDDPLFKLAV